jgi:hypothetical protein
MKKRNFAARPWFEDLTSLLKDLSQMNRARIWEGVMTGMRSLYKGVPGARQTISPAVMSWGTTQRRHRYGGTEWRLGRREIGHIHGNYLVDIPFPKKVRDHVIAAGEAETHHILPESGWVSFFLREPEDVERAIALLRRSYELAAAQQSRRKADSKR